MTHVEPIPPVAKIQDHLSLAAERNWSLFVFFRILSNEEVSRQLELERALKKKQQPHAPAELVKAELAAIDPKAIAFHDLPVRLAADSDAHKVIEKVRLDRSYFLDFLKRLLRLDPSGASEDVTSRVGPLDLPPAHADPLAAADHWFRQGLRGICMHEALRYSQPDLVAGKHAILRARSGGAADAEADVGAADSGRYSAAPVNIAFTHQGLAALKKVQGGEDRPVLDKEMLASFPDAFRKGMAARAKSLGDTGPSAPEYWEGELGKPSIQGMLTASFDVGTRHFRHWDRVRREVEEFNNGDADLRLDLRRLFLTFGFEILHLEFGQIPYDLPQGEGGDVKPLDARREHFGFRDGISQPFVDLGLKTPLPGGGTPLRDGSWAPVAAGEIYLGEPDEDGHTADQPIHATLRDGGTYLVFRKLEQDVAGFRAFIEHERKTEPERERLAAQFVGRWRDGAPLVRHPDFDASYVGRKADARLNDFRYRTEDPHGVKCPIGAHVRRVNPRDTGGRNEAKYHRILRRGIAYGGPMLPAGSKGDGRSRGLLFVAANARIEMQFEVIQRDWINAGEFLGQVGAGRCPLTGTNSGSPQDRFLEGGAIAPICGIPSFVTTKGGDYFFAPGIEALKAIAKGEFPADNRQHRLELGMYSASTAETPAMQTQAKIQDYAAVLLGTNRLIRSRLPREQSDEQLDAPPTTFVFVGQHAHVSRVLRSRIESGNRPAFSVAHYLKASREITRGGAQLLAMDEGEPLGLSRLQRLDLMNDLRKGLNWGTPEHSARIQRLIRGEVDRIVHRVAGMGRIDILQDLAFHICHRLVEELIGISGPSHLSELAVSLPFAKRHIMQLPPDWLKGRSPSDVANPAYATMQIWSRLAFAEVIGNILNKRELTQVAIQATSELLMHIDERIAEERFRRPKPPADNALRWLVQNAPATGEAEYFNEVRTVLADLIVTISMNIALPFSKALQAALDFGFNLAWLVPALREEDEKAPGRQLVERLFYELLRLFPSAPAIYRRCEVDTELEIGPLPAANGKAEAGAPPVIKAGEWVACLLPVAGQDFRVFPEPKRFSLGKGLNLPKHLESYGKYERRLDDYLLFGPAGGVHRCWGERLGRLVLAELFYAAARFPGLTRVAGFAGQVVELPTRMDYSLKLKFHPFDPNEKRMPKAPHNG